MENDFGSEAERVGPGEAAEGANEAFRISAPDAEGHRFIVALEPDGHDSPPASGESDRYSREGA